MVNNFTPSRIGTITEVFISLYHVALRMHIYNKTDDRKKEASNFFMKQFCNENKTKTNQFDFIFVCRSIVFHASSVASHPSTFKSLLNKNQCLFVKAPAAILQMLNFKSGQNHSRFVGRGLIRKNTYEKAF